jgi:hypothetical protein
MKVIKHSHSVSKFWGFYKKIKSLRKRSAAIGPFGSALPPPMQKVFGRKMAGKICKPASIRLCG